jgi:heme exporter protein B
MVLGFFVVAVVLFPLGVGPEPQVLTRIAPGILWVSALLAAMLSLDRLFQTDYEDGSLEQMVLAPAPLEFTVIAKVFAHWLTTGLPMLVAAPLLAVLLHLDSQGFNALLAGLALGTPILSLLGAVGAALVLGARRGGVLMTVLVLPLTIPVLILGAGIIDAARQDLPYGSLLMFMGAILALAIPLAPLAAAAAIRQAID